MINLQSNEFLGKSLECKDHMTNLEWKSQIFATGFKSTNLGIKGVEVKVKLTGKNLIIFSLQVNSISVGIKTII